MLEKNEVSRQNSATIVKYVESIRTGIHMLNLSRCAIGYVVRGEKHIYYGDSHHIISRGEVFYLGVGNHYVEDIPEEGKGFEQVVVYYSSALLQRILLFLNMSYSINITNSHHCERCRRMNHISMPARGALRGLFVHMLSYLQDDCFMHDATAENIKMTELIYLIVSQEDSCLKTKILSNVDASHDNFEHIIYSNVFNELSIEALASQSHRSLTSFKKEFKRHFLIPPHRWFIRQRLMHSRLLLVSTSKSVSEIGNECAFPNTSHFIKLFKKEYGTTPAIYRQQHRHNQPNEIAENLSMVAEQTQVGGIAL